MGDLIAESTGVLDAADTHRPDFRRADALLRAALLLLSRRGHLAAVAALHAGARRALGSNGVGASYESRSAAEQAHWQLVLAAQRERRWRQSASARGRVLRERLVVWGSWATVLAIATGLTLRYAYARVERASWLRQYPEGNWISRYYPTESFVGAPLVRYDLAVQHDWGMRAPAGAMARDHWSAIWDSCLVVKDEIELALSLSADERAQLLVDDVVRITVPKPGTTVATLRLQPGVRHVRVQYQERRRVAKLHLAGLESTGAGAYLLMRPLLEGDEVRCAQRGPG